MYFIPQESVFNSLLILSIYCPLEGSSIKSACSEKSACVTRLIVFIVFLINFRKSSVLQLTHKTLPVLLLLIFSASFLTFRLFLGVLALLNYAQFTKSTHSMPLALVRIVPSPPSPSFLLFTWHISSNDSLILLLPQSISWPSKSSLQCPLRCFPSIL